MRFWYNIGKFLSSLLNEEDGTSSKRFLAIFIYTPLVIFTVFLDKPLDVIIALLTMILTLLGLTSIEKFRKNFKKLGDKELK